MRVLFLITLINSKAKYHPGIASLSAVLKENGKQVELLEMYSMDYGKLKSRIEAFKPNVVAATSNVHQFPYVKDALGYIHSHYADIKLVLGGVHATLHPQAIEEIDGLEALFVGEGEGPLLDYVTNYENGRGDLANISNIVFKKDGKCVANPVSYFVRDLNSLPFPDYSIFGKFRGRKKLDFPVRFLFNRGCPFDCSYCCNYALRRLFAQKSQYVRMKTPQRVVEELLSFSGKYEFERFVIDDDIFTLNKRWILEFCDIYPAVLRKKKFEITVRVGTIDLEIAQRLRSIGCDLIKIGLETGSPRLRERVLERNISEEDIYRTADIIHKAGIAFHTFNMVGFPDETKKEAWDTVKINRKLRPEKVQLTVFYPYRKTKLGDMCYSNDLVRKDRSDSYFSESIIKTQHLKQRDIMFFVKYFKFLVYIAYNKKKAAKELVGCFKKTARQKCVVLKRFLSRAFAGKGCNGCADRE